MLAFDGLPLTHFMGQGFQRINGNLTKDLGVALGRDAMYRLIMNKFDESKQALMKSIEGKFLYLKFDGVTRLRKHYLGLSVQYVEYDNANDITGHLAGKTLALIDTKSKSDSQSTKDMVFDVLNQFNIVKTDILACVVDNASAMTRTVELMNEDEEVDDGMDEANESDEIDEMDEEEEGDEIEGVDESLLTDVGIHHMRCAEHTLQLGKFILSLEIHKC